MKSTCEYYMVSVEVNGKAGQKRYAIISRKLYKSIKSMNKSIIKGG